MNRCGRSNLLVAAGFLAEPRSGYLNLFPDWVLLAAVGIGLFWLEKGALARLPFFFQETHKSPRSAFILFRIRKVHCLGTIVVGATPLRANGEKEHTGALRRCDPGMDFVFRLDLRFKTQKGGGHWFKPRASIGKACPISC
jgi:hypothetical protein